MIRSISQLFFRAVRGGSPRPEPRAHEVPASSAANDPWFWSHYRDAANIVLSLVPSSCFESGRNVVDFGCGDGAMALGVASRTEARVVGVDLYKTYLRLSVLAKENLGTERLPATLAFEQTTLGAPLPFAAGSIDLVYSWSVFEHLADAAGTLAEFTRIVRHGGRLFIQIEPLYYGPFGSHLRRLVAEPWAHLLHDADDFLRMAAGARDTVPDEEKDILYRTHAFDELKAHLLDEYRSLNRITADELVRLVRRAGFRIEESRRIAEEGLRPDPRLLERYPLELLVTNQIVLVAVKE